MADSIVYQGYDFSEWTTAEVTLRPAHEFDVVTAKVPGRAGRVVVSWDTKPLPMRVKLMLRPEARMDDEALSELRKRIRLAFYPRNPYLCLPDEPGLEWRDVYLQNVDAFTSLFEDGECELEFICLDPYAWGDEKAGKAGTFEVGGNAPTAPQIKVIAAAGDHIQITNDATGESVRVNYPFVGGELVTIENEDFGVYMNNKNVSAYVSLYSTFFTLAPGVQNFSSEGTSDFTVYFTERWI